MKKKTCITESLCCNLKPTQGCNQVYSNKRPPKQAHMEPRVLPGKVQLGQGIQSDDLVSQEQTCTPRHHPVLEGSGISELGEMFPLLIMTSVNSGSSWWALGKQPPVPSDLAGPAQSHLGNTVWHTGSMSQPTGPESGT